jgi:hypothetical protein
VRGVASASASLSLRSILTTLVAHWYCGGLQTSLIAFLSEHEEQMGAIGDMPVGDLHLVTEPCVSVRGPYPSPQP